MSINDMFSDIEVIRVEMGNRVICDICDKEWTDSPVSGGYLFGSYGVCPDCAVGDFNKGVERHKEQGFIKAWCPQNMSHADWIRDVIRGGS